MARQQRPLGPEELMACKRPNYFHKVCICCSRVGCIPFSLHACSCSPIHKYQDAALRESGPFAN
eukprot:7065129-Prymnesium_polylepis.1